MKKLIFLLPVLFSFSINAQSVKERNEARLIKNSENAKICSIGLISFCIDEDYEAFYGDRRKLGQVIYDKGENCCLKYPKYPFISPMEEHLANFENEKEIRKYATNPFQLKKVRAQLKPSISKLISKANTQGYKNLPYYTDQGFTVEDYDFNTNELIVKSFYGQSISFRADTKGNFAEDFKLTKSISGDYRIAINETKAEKLYAFFDKYPMVGKNLFVKLSYNITSNDRKSKYGKFMVTITKIEFFYPDNWNDKLGEVILD